jgi:hexosaminidase
MRAVLLAFLVVCGLARVVHAQDGARLRILPAPARLVERTGRFIVDARTRFVLSDPRDAELRRIAGHLAAPLRSASGFPLPIADDTTTQGGAIALHVSARSPTSPYDWADRIDESYRLSVATEGVRIDADTHAGLFRAIQTLRQLLPLAGSTEAATWSIPAVEIEDEPRFPYRGMHLDVGRHLFPVSFIRAYIDLLAAYRMNVFHWHLTEDQGWRIEIRNYPRLTSVGAYRSETIVERNFDPYVGDGIRYGGFYTQDEIRDIVQYAAERYITIVPEIEMPGHSVAALAAYPELACTPGPFEVYTRWGVTADIYCPSERTFSFLEDVLTEVMELFPGRYIHIGGDEAPKDAWEQSALAQDVMRREGLANENELQSWFIRRIETFLAAHDRRIIGWDEILEGGLAREATVMSWRGTTGGIEAARQRHDVIMTPTSHMYFDYYQGDPRHEPLANGGVLPLDRVYGFEPVPEELSADEARHVLGAQGNVWTEYMKTTDHVEYMVMPRMLALSEVVWSPADARDWTAFQARLPAQLARLDAIPINYRVPEVTGLDAGRITLDDTMRVTLGSVVPGVIRYTTNGSDPTASSARYTGPLVLSLGDSAVRVSARLFLPDGRTSAPRSAQFRRTTLREPASVVDLVTGLNVAYFEGTFRSADDVRNWTPLRSAITDRVAIPDDAREERFALRFNGYVRVPTDGIWTFVLNSDDGSRLRIDGDLVVDHDGAHGPSDLSGQIALRAGWHSIEVLYFQGGGGRSLALSMAPAGETPRALPTTALGRIAR